MATQSIVGDKSLAFAKRIASTVNFNHQVNKRENRITIIFYLLSLNL